MFFLFPVFLYFRQLWDTVTHPNVNLGAIADSIPSYQAQDYAKDVSGLNLRSAVHIEAVVGQVNWDCLYI